MPLSRHNDLEKCRGAQVVKLTLPDTFRNVALAKDQSVLPTLSSGPQSMAPGRFSAGYGTQLQGTGRATERAGEVPAGQITAVLTK